MFVTSSADITIREEERKEGRKERKGKKKLEGRKGNIGKEEGTEMEKCLLISSRFGTFEFPQS